MTNLLPTTSYQGGKQRVDKSKTAIKVAFYSE